MDGIQTAEKKIDIIDTDNLDENASEDVLLPEDCQFIIENSTPNIESLILDWKDMTLRIPEFQRGFVWDIKQASRFIESLLLNLPVPNLFFYRDNKSETYFIVDGQQRIKTVFYFLGILDKDEIPKRERKFLNFKLQGLSPLSPWYEKTYSSLSEQERKRLKKKTLHIVTVSLTSDAGMKGIFHIFERLNTGGTVLTPQEIRNCVYAGKFNNFLFELNQNEYWRKIVAIDTEKSHQKDVELILRFFALTDNLLRYKKPMKNFLSEYMGSPGIVNISAREMERKRVMFNSTVEAIYENLGEKPFHIRSTLNSAVCDSVMIAFSRNLANIPTNVHDRYFKLSKENEEYYRYVSKSTDESKSLYKRIQMVIEHLFT